MASPRCVYTSSPIPLDPTRRALHAADLREWGRRHLTFGTWIDGGDAGWFATRDVIWSEGGGLVDEVVRGQLVAEELHRPALTRAEVAADDLWQDRSTGAPFPAIAALLGGLGPDDRVSIAALARLVPEEFRDERQYAIAFGIDGGGWIEHEGNLSDIPDEEPLLALSRLLPTGSAVEFHEARWIANWDNRNILDLSARILTVRADGYWDLRETMCPDADDCLQVATTREDRR